MSSLFGTLSSTAASLEAQRRGLEVAGQNIANANSVGYSRRTLELRERPSNVLGDPGGGVAVSQVRAVRDVFLEARIRQEQQGVSRDTVVANTLSVVEAQLGRPGDSVDAQLSSFFDAFQALADDPASLTLRDAVGREADRVGTAFREMASRLDQTRRNADAGVRSTVDEINTIVEDIARMNERIAAAAGIDTESMIDGRNARLNDLAHLVDITATDASGTMTVALASGQTLVSGGHMVGLTLENAPGTGLARVLNNGDDITSSITGGAAGGWLEIRDARIPTYTGMLDRLAFDIGNAVNAAHQSGTDANGDPAVALFDVAATPDGAAAALRVNDAVTADARLISAAGASANGTAQAIAGLRDAAVVAGSSTVSDYWGQLLYRVGADSAAAVRVQDGRQQVMTQLTRLREQASGVSLDEEASSLMRYQRAYEANARYFSLVNDVLDTLMGMVR